MTIQVTSVLPRDQLTENEVMAAAATIRGLKELRRMAAKPEAGALIVDKAYSPFERSFKSVKLSQEDVEACLALLIERHSAVLTGLNVTLSEPVK